MMNEEVLQRLEREAEKITLDMPASLDDREFTRVFNLEFARLIVKECADILMKESERLYKLESEETDELFARDFEVCAEKCVDNVVALKEHFGVE